MHRDVQTIQATLEAQGYIADRDIATAIHLAQTLERPLLVEGPAGVGKTEIAKTMTRILETELIRLQCYEGLDTQTAIYEWNYQRQLLELRRSDSSTQQPNGTTADIFSERYLLERPLLKAIRANQPTVLLIDEIDRADEEFEAFLLELLSEWQLSIPELGTLKAKYTPYTVLTSNRTRELSDALRRRCLYLWIDYPAFTKELQIIRQRVPGLSEKLSRDIIAVVQLLRQAQLDKTPGVAESLDWAAALVMLHAERLDHQVMVDTLSVLLKHKNDQVRFRTQWLDHLLTAVEELGEEVDEAWLQRFSLTTV